MVDFHSGRTVRIPNSFALKGQVFNCSQGFHFLWDEIRIRLTVDSDLDLAREMLLLRKRSRFRLPRRGSELLEESQRQLSPGEFEFGTDGESGRE